MLFSASTYSEIPISSTYQMFLTSNGEHFNWTLSLKKIKNIPLNVEEKAYSESENKNAGIILSIQKMMDVQLSLVK
jgi:hypothetical protein